LSKKYLDEENLTRDRFQINPSTKTAADVIFRTGDMGCYLPDGRVAYAGRKDGQVKLRGFRVELAEVESCLREFEGVRECVVAASEDRHGENQLVAYIVPVATDFATRLPGLRDFLKQKVPAYMIPSAFAILERMPLTPNGKIDRKALRDVPLVDPVVAKGPAVPSTPLEQQLAQIWQRILSLPTVGVRDNFFDLGGHSLMAVRLVSEINRTLHFNMRVLNLFQHPTIESLAKILEFQTTDHQKQGLVQLQHGNFGPEIFFIVDEGSMDLFQLARSMDESRAVYASLVPLSDAMLHASAHRHSARFPTMEELAAGHAELIRSHQKNRPCLLGGHCFGGMLAFEVAQQLRRMGTPVEAVFLMDTWLKRPSRTWWLKTWLQTHVRNLVKDGPAYLWRKSRHRFNLEWRQLVSTIMPATFNNPPEPQFTRPIVRRLYRHASKMYGPQVLASRGILLLSKDDWAANAFRKLHPEMGATPFFRDGLLVVDVPGDHVTMLKDTNIQVLAEVCNRHLRAK
jgi:thioesterase domain-containing protein/acyl carrier protein